MQEAIGPLRRVGTGPLLLGAGHAETPPRCGGRGGMASHQALMAVDIGEADMIMVHIHSD